MNKILTLYSFDQNIAMSSFITVYINGLKISIYCPIIAAILTSPPVLILK